MLDSSLPLTLSFYPLPPPPPPPPSLPLSSLPPPPSSLSLFSLSSLSPSLILPSHFHTLLSLTLSLSHPLSPSLHIQKLFSLLSLSLSLTTRFSHSPLSLLLSFLKIIYFRLVVLFFIYSA